MASDFLELGTTGLKRSGGQIAEEFLPVLQGQRGRKVYREMSDNDPIIGGMLFGIDKIVTRLDWHVEGEDERTAQFVEECLNDMSDSWDATLSNILSMLPYGWSFHEIVYKKRAGLEADPSSNYTDGRIGWRKWPVRSQDSLSEWRFDEAGGLEAMVQSSDRGMPITIPMEKALLFRTTTNKANPEGRSLLRNAYRPWFYKRRIEEIEAIGIERDLAGLPVAYMPPEYLSSDATAAQKAVRDMVVDIVQNIKRNEQEGVVFPAVYDDHGNRVFDLTLLSAGGSRQFDTGAVIQRYDSRIAMTLLADFLLLGSDKVGSFALGASKLDLFTMAVDSIAKSIAEVVNQYAIPRLLRLNAMRTDLLPRLTYGQVSSVDLQELGEYVQRLAGAGILVPDRELEAYMRSMADLPEAMLEEDEGLPALPMPGPRPGETPPEEPEEPETPETPEEEPPSPGAEE
jgi:phage gp29-like protein